MPPAGQNKRSVVARPQAKGRQVATGSRGYINSWRAPSGKSLQWIERRRKSS